MEPKGVKGCKTVKKKKKRLEAKRTHTCKNNKKAVFYERVGSLVPKKKNGQLRLKQKRNALFFFFLNRLSSFFSKKRKLPRCRRNSQNSKKAIKKSFMVKDEKGRRETRERRKRHLINKSTYMYMYSFFYI